VAGRQLLEKSFCDEMVAVLRQVFDRAVVREYADNDFQMYEWGPRDLFAVRKTGQSLRLVLRTQSESKGGCGDIVPMIKVLRYVVDFSIVWAC
jgi:hypothetical protein